MPADDAVGSGSAGRETSCEVDEKARQRRLERLQVMEKERRKAVKAARRRLRQAKLQTQSENSHCVRSLLLCFCVCDTYNCFAASTFMPGVHHSVAVLPLPFPPAFAP